MAKILNFSKKINPRLKIIELKCPYASYKDDESVRKFYELMVCLKLEGYFSRHRRGCQPVDDSDFIADHVLICEETAEGLIPLLGSKFLPRDICQNNNIDFTIAKLMQDISFTQHYEYIALETMRAFNERKRVSYHGSWTMHPDINKHPIRNQLKDIFAAISVHYCNDQGINELYGIGLPKLKTDTFFYNWGYERAKRGASILEEFPVKFLHSMPGVLMHLKNFNEFANQLAHEYRSLWENREVVGISDYESRNKEVA